MQRNPIHNWLHFLLKEAKKKKNLHQPLFPLSRLLSRPQYHPHRPFSSQSQHFDCILHKLYDDQWVSILEKSTAENPSALIIDPPELIKRTQDRISMVRFVAEMKIPSNLEPLAVDGSGGSHKIALVFNQDGLLKQNPPLILQEFVNHGGVVLKVYVTGDYSKCIKRKSIPDLSIEKLAAFEHVGSVSFSQISNMTVAENEVDMMNIGEVEMPPEGFVIEIARELRSAM